MCSVLRVFEGPRTQMGLTGKGKQTSDIATTACYRYVGGGGGHASENAPILVYEIDSYRQCRRCTSVAASKGQSVAIYIHNS